MHHQVQTSYNAEQICWHAFSHLLLQPNYLINIFHTQKDYCVTKYEHRRSKLQSEFFVILRAQWRIMWNICQLLEVISENTKRKANCWQSSEFVEQESCFLVIVPAIETFCEIFPFFVCFLINVLWFHVLSMFQSFVGAFSCVSYCF